MIVDSQDHKNNKYEKQNILKLRNNFALQYFDDQPGIQFTSEDFKYFVKCNKISKIRCNIYDGHTFQLIQFLELKDAIDLDHVIFQSNNQFFLYFFNNQLYVYGFQKQTKTFTDEPVIKYDNITQLPKAFHNGKLYLTNVKSNDIKIYDVPLQYDKKQIDQKGFLLNKTIITIKNQSKSISIVKLLIQKFSNNIFIIQQNYYFDLSQIAYIIQLNSSDNYSIINKNKLSHPIIQITYSRSYKFFITLAKPDLTSSQGILSYLDAITFQQTPIDSILFYSDRILKISQNGHYIFFTQKRSIQLWYRSSVFQQFSQVQSFDFNDQSLTNSFNQKQMILYRVSLSQQNNYLNVQLYSLCLKNQYYNQSKNYCFKCSDQCGQCFEYSQKNCSSCTGQKQIDSKQSYQCFLCNSFMIGCNKCKQRSVCLECDGSKRFIYNNQTKKCNCKSFQQHWFLNHTSMQCDCIQRYALVNQKCQICQALGCLRCDSDNLQKCYKCDIQNHWTKGLNSTCLCEQSYYQNLNLQICETCLTGCKTCISGQTCQECYSQFHKTTNQKISCSCNDQFSFPTKTKCIKCIWPCLQCNNETSCLSCVEDFDYQEESFHCKQKSNFWRNILIIASIIFAIFFCCMLIKCCKNRQKKGQQDFYEIHKQKKYNSYSVLSNSSNSSYYQNDEELARKMQRQQQQCQARRQRQQQRQNKTDAEIQKANKRKVYKHKRKK